MAQRLTMHSGYRNAMGKAYNSKHDQREKFSKPQNGDTQPPENVYWDYASGLGGETFSENENRFFKKYLGPHIERQNKKAIERRQYGRTQTVAGYKEKHPPEEVLLYLGTENVDVAALEAVFRDFKTWLVSDCWDKETGGVMPLNAALHLDETTPHIHMRQVYLYRDKAGDWQVSQNKALEALGYERPDTSKPVGRMNNAKMTFTATCREKLLELARIHGVELETEPLPRNEVGLPIGEYVQRQQAREAAAAEQQAARQTIEGLEADIAELEDEKQDVREEIEKARGTYSKELKAREQKRKDAEQEAKEILEDARKEARELKEIAIREGAESALGRLNTMTRERDRRESLTGEERRQNAQKDGIGRF